MGGKKLTGWGKNGPAYFFPGERMGRPILSPGKKLTGGKFRPVTPPYLPEPMRIFKVSPHSNNFTFDGEHYLQIGGTAMGTRVAPSLDNKFIGEVELETKMVETAPFKPFLYLRYIDDIFLIWTGSLSELKCFYQHCNSFHTTIKFTIEYSEKQVSF